MKKTKSKKKKLQEDRSPSRYSQKSFKSTKSTKSKISQKTKKLKKKYLDSISPSSSNTLFEKKRSKSLKNPGLKIKFKPELNYKVPRNEADQMNQMQQYHQ